MKTLVWMIGFYLANGEPNIQTATTPKFDTLAHCQALADRINEHYALFKKPPTLSKPIYFCAEGVVIEQAK